MRVTAAEEVGRAVALARPQEGVARVRVAPAGSDASASCRLDSPAANHSSCQLSRFPGSMRWAMANTSPTSHTRLDALANVRCSCWSKSASSKYSFMGFARSRVRGRPGSMGRQGFVAGGGRRPRGQVSGVIASFGISTNRSSTFSDDRPGPRSRTGRPGGHAAASGGSPLPCPLPLRSWDHHAMIDGFDQVGLDRTRHDWDGTAGATGVVTDAGCRNGGRGLPRRQSWARARGPAGDRVPLRQPLVVRDQGRAPTSSLVPPRHRRRTPQPLSLSSVPINR